MLRLRSLVLLVALPLLLVAVAPRSCWFGDRDVYGGWTGLALGATGRFRVEQHQGVWWLVTPDGHAFFSAGINNVSIRSDYAPALSSYPYRDAALAKHGSEAAWADAVLARFAAAGVNTAGAWSQLERFRGRFPYTQIESFSARAPTIPGTDSVFGPALRDFFDPAYESGAVLEAEETRVCAEDPWCIGVFTDNELPWGPGFTQAIPHLDAYMKLPAGAPGKRALQAFLESRHGGDLAAFNAAWSLTLASFDEIQALDALSANFRRDGAQAQADRLAFRGHVAAQYFRVAHDALRAVDPALLILGARFIAYGTGADTAEAAAPYVDVLSANPYEWNEIWFAAARNSARLNDHLPFDELLDDVDGLYAAAGKPILITEFGYRAEGPETPNSYPPVYPVLADQAERADAYEAYLDQVLARPHVVGAHWFEHADQPATGRFDGEDNNWGFVDIHDEVYAELFLRMWSVHVRMYGQRARLATP